MENKKKNHKSLGENLYEAPLDSKKVKRKDISSSEFLDQTLEDEGFDLPAMFPLLPERSSLLIEETDTINMGTEDSQRMWLLQNPL